MQKLVRVCVAIVMTAGMTPMAAVAQDAAPAPAASAPAIPSPPPPAASAMPSPAPAQDAPAAPVPSEPASPAPPDTTAADPAASTPAASPVTEPEASPAPETIVPSPAPSPGVSPSISASALPQDLSPWGMFMQADIVVKAVMIGLAFASLVTWTIWLAKGVELAAARRRARSCVRKLSRAENLAAARAAIDGGWTRKGTVADLMAAAEREMRRSPDLSAEGVKERSAIALSRIEARAGRDIARGTGLLATIGATAPFVGLFGTVWGIMNSFIGISQSKTTNLAVVAPGIAEALLATALGLVAAIPAVIIYNVFARALASHRAVLSDASGEIVQHLSRDLERQERGLAPQQSPPVPLSLARARPAAE